MTEQLVARLADLLECIGQDPDEWWVKQRVADAQALVEAAHIDGDVP